MKLKRVKLLNFQSHRNSVIEFHDGITTIVGNSDVGKSSIIRAIRWVMRNEPLGDGYWNKPAKAAGESYMVGLAIEVDGQEVTVIREKSNTLNEYRVYKPGKEDPDSYTGFGRDVPAPVRALLGVPVSFGKGLDFDLNIVGQHDDSFLLKGITPRDFARVLGKLSGIDVIDQAEQIAQSTIRQINSKAKTLRGELERIQGEIEALPDLERAKVKIDLIEAMENAANTMSRQQKTIATLVGSVEAIKGNASKIDVILVKATPQIEATTKAITKLENQMAIYERLAAAINQREVLETQRMQLSSVISSKSIEFGEAVSELATTVDEMKVCPLSQGTLYKKCKELLKSV
jgi:exonuclease SbcC